jgi:hypothetical protein
VHEAVQIFYPEGQVKQNDAILKYAMKRANGTGAWASLRPRDWSSVVAQDGEIGVFIRTDSLDLPYEPTSGKHVAVGTLQLWCYICGDSFFLVGPD